VFPLSVPIKVYKKGNTLYGPGISDNSTGLVGLVALAEVMVRLKKKPDRDVWFIANVCEEGNGDLKGMKYLFHKSTLRSKIGELIAIDGDGLDRVVINGVGSVRYEVTVTGPGGHSYGAFGLVNPIYVLCDFMVQFKSYKVPTRYKTTYNIGVVTGGTSVNTIPEQVTAQVDMRSVNKAALAKLGRHFFRSLKTAEKVNRSRYGKGFSIKATKIGERPVGHTSGKSGLVRSVKKVWKDWGYKPQFNWSSTDANIPMSLNLPAVCVKLGGKSKGGHTIREKYNVTGREKGICLILDLVMRRTGITRG
jgi:acetylornithine deacetylase/succinyl-diaminopimelate desuccinylase-like protein